MSRSFRRYAAALALCIAALLCIAGIEHLPKLSVRSESAAVSVAMQAQVQQLLAEILELEERIVALGGTPVPLPPSLQATSVPSPAAAPGFSCSFARTLARGASGDDVSCLQRFLITQNLLDPDSATGYFGPLTEAAVQRFQGSHSIVSSGTAATTGYGSVGPQTRAALALSVPRQTAIATPVATSGGGHTSGGGGGSKKNTPDTPDTSEPDVLTQLATTLDPFAISSAQYALRVATEPSYNIYMPHAQSSEVAASTLAFYGEVVLQDYQRNHGTDSLAAAEHLAESIAEYPDMNGNSLWGWGRFWSGSPSTNGIPVSMPGDGSNTTFITGCTRMLNKPYDTEIYDDGIIIPFLIETGAASGNRHLIDVARRAIDDASSTGAVTYGDGFYYWKTEGPCEEGWHVKNTNIQMAVGLFEVYQVLEAAGSPDARGYYDRGLAVLRAELKEYNYAGYPGINAPVKNFGYYGVATELTHGIETGSAYVTGTWGTQTAPTPDDPVIRCNMNNSNGRSCAAHLGIEADSLVKIGQIMGSPTLDGAMPNLNDIAREIMEEFFRLDQAGIFGQTFPSDPGYDFPRVAYYCEFRSMDPSFAQLCLDRLKISQTMKRTNVTGNTAVWRAVLAGYLSSPLPPVAAKAADTKRYLFLPVSNAWTLARLQPSVGASVGTLTLKENTEIGQHYGLITIPLSAGFDTSDTWKFTFTAQPLSGSKPIRLRAYIIDAANPQRGYGGMRCLTTGTTTPSAWNEPDASDLGFTVTPNISMSAAADCSLTVKPDAYSNGSIRLQFALERDNGTITYPGDGFSGVRISGMSLEANPASKTAILASQSEHAAQSNFASVLEAVHSFFFSLRAL